MIAHLESVDSDEYARILYCFHMGFILPFIRFFFVMDFELARLRRRRLHLNWREEDFR